MIRYCIAAVILFAAMHLRPAEGSDLEVQLQIHPIKIQYGDPVYIEVTITNTGKENVVARKPDLLFGTFYFRFYDPETHTSTTSGQGFGLVGGLGSVTYEPGKPIRHYWIVFAPHLHQLDHAFWKPTRASRTMIVSGEYALSKTLLLKSDLNAVRIVARDEAELRHLEKWTREKSGFYEGPSPTSIGIDFEHRMNRQQTLEILAPLRPSELADLLQLSIRMQEIYEAPPDARATNNKLLVEWLQEQPRIKRLALVKEVRGLADSYKLLSTKAALEAVSGDE